MSIELQLTADTRPTSQEKLDLLCPPEVTAKCTDELLGWQAERRVALLLLRQNEVASVRFSPVDQPLVDLLVTLKPFATIGELGVLKVQVKRNNRHRDLFYTALKRALDNQGTPLNPESRRNWMAENGMMMLPGEYKIRKSRVNGVRKRLKEKIALSDQDIINHWQRAFSTIQSHHTSNELAVAA